MNTELVISIFDGNEWFRLRNVSPHDMVVSPSEAQNVVKKENDVTALPLINRNQSTAEPRLLLLCDVIFRSHSEVVFAFELSGFNK